MATTTAHPSEARRRYEEIAARRRDAAETIRLCDEELDTLLVAYPGIDRPSRVIFLVDDTDGAF